MSDTPLEPQEKRFLSSYLLDCAKVMTGILYGHQRGPEHASLLRKGAGHCIVCDQLAAAKSRLTEEVERLAVTR